MSEGDLETVKLRDFLGRLNAATPDLLPLVHTTPGYNLLKVLKSQKLMATRCSVFGEDLCYLFVGRPSYKVQVQPNPKYWQLPVVFVVKFDESLNFKRVFPFDSGAFSRKLLPNSITCFPMENFDISGDSQRIGRFIAAFFGDNERFFKAKAFGEDVMLERHLIGPLEMEIQALIDLYNRPRTDDMDDRAAAVEAQLDSDLHLSKGDLLGVIMPEDFRREPAIAAKLSDMGCQVKYYDTYPISTSGYYSEVYRLAKKIIETRAGQ